MSDKARRQAIQNVTASAAACVTDRIVSESAQELFGEDVFNLPSMKEFLPPQAYEKLLETVRDRAPLDPDIAGDVAGAMKAWALGKGASHYTHWFQPLTGGTAEKHDAFLEPDHAGGVTMKFSAKNLVVGESDASSFPSGGLRSTFEARGYTAWDPTSPAFLRRSPAGATLCIPTAFCSYTGEALDKKTPLLRSIRALSDQIRRMLDIFGVKDAGSPEITLGVEQEYFLIDRNFYLARPDLIQTGRTLFGAPPPKHQQLDDHYYGTIKARILAFMTEVDQTLWRLGIPAKTRHNEVAPAQHELAPIYTTTNIATDHNQLTMEIMQKVASRHGMVCLLHEKPFAGVNGSGKHNNWSLTTNTGMNLLEPGETPAENAQFLLFLCAVIQAVDDYQDMLRISVASAANDHRLGANEAPPAVVSMYVGDEIENILDAIVNETSYAGQEKELLKIGVHALPRFPKDTTDRNRTSPFAFTGNKFEFRMPGSSASISGINVVLNTAVAESLEQFADALEGSKNFEADLQALIRSVLIKHKRILFNGNGYDDAWLAEAERRGLLNLRTTPEALPYYLADKNVALFTKHRVYTRTEMEARYEIHLENYSKVLNIEALTMLEMARRDIMPAVSSYLRELSETATAIHAVSVTADCSYEESIIPEMSALLGDACRKVRSLDEALMGAKTVEGSQALANYYRDKVFSAMAELRITIDQLETMMPSDKWPVPSYGELLFSVR